MRHIKLNDRRTLNWMLRDHRKNGVYELNEIEYRDAVDSLLQYYALLVVGIVLRVLPKKLPKPIEHEILTILNDSSVKKYYEEYYPLLLPSFLLTCVQYNCFPRSLVNTSDHFNDLLLLNALLDDDVEVFLWFLDNGTIDGYGMAELQKVLNRKNKVEEIIERRKDKEDYIEVAFWGFLKFTVYMERYAKLLKSCRNEFIRSILWHYQGYWFGKMSKQMQNKYLKGVHNIRSLSTKYTLQEFRQLMKESNGSESLSEKHLISQFRRWKKNNDDELKQTLACIKYDLMLSHGKILKNKLSSMRRDFNSSTKVEPTRRLTRRKGKSKRIGIEEES